jgi:hypothetical protein
MHPAAYASVPRGRANVAQLQRSFPSRVHDMVIMEKCNVYKLTQRSSSVLFMKESTLDLSWVLLGQKQLKT